MLIDHRNTAPRSIPPAPQSILFDLQPMNVDMDVDLENTDLDKVEMTRLLLDGGLTKTTHPLSDC